MTNLVSKDSQKSLLFQPWVGEKYGSDSLFGIPILIVGESNYTDNPEREQPHATFTQRLIQNVTDGCRRHRFFRYVQCAFRDNVTPAEFWQSVAHHEYIQDWLPSYSVPPSEAMWEKAKPLFQEVVDELQPKCILFIGRGVYDRVSKDFPRSKDLNIDDEESLSVYQSVHPTIQIDNAIGTWIYHSAAWGRKSGFKKPGGVVSKVVQAAGGDIKVLH